jgi:hypothetical protein
MKSIAGFGFSAAGLGEGVGSGVATGTGVDFCTRLPDCGAATAEIAEMHIAASVMHQIARRKYEAPARFAKVITFWESILQAF